ncbi:unnamed protein product, partial [Polarella glacialis]
AIQAGFPQHICVHDMLRAQAARSPHSAAVYCDLSGTWISYAGLSARVNGLAAHLVDLGVGPDVAVGLWVERSFELLVGAYGVLTAGGAYVPLDPALPAKRMAVILDDIRSTGDSPLLTQRSLVARAGIEIEALLETCRPICIDVFKPVNSRPPISKVKPDNLCYVMYTSGSTGRPKGVLVQHRGVVNYVCNRVRLHRLGITDTVLQKTPYTFDVSLWELVVPLAVGARMVLARPGRHVDPEYLWRILRSRSVSA